MRYKYTIKMVMKDITSYYYQTTAIVKKSAEVIYLILSMNVNLH